MYSTHMYTAQYTHVHVHCTVHTCTCTLHSTHMYNEIVSPIDLLIIMQLWKAHYNHSKIFLVSWSIIMKSVTLTPSEQTNKRTNSLNTRHPNTSRARSETQDLSGQTRPARVIPLHDTNTYFIFWFVFFISCTSSTINTLSFLHFILGSSTLIIISS